MKLLQSSVIACSLALAGTAWAQTSNSDSSYLQRVTPQYQSFAGSTDNLSSLTTGLRSGSPITLTGNGQTSVFTPSTRPMGYGNITRSLDLAQRQLAAQGITNPTPSQLQAALQGGTITGPNGTTTYAGILKMRSDGMGWGKIANTVGVHPGLGKSTSAAPAATTASSARITTPRGNSANAPGNARSDSVRASGNGDARVTPPSRGNSASEHANARGLGSSAPAHSSAGANAGGMNAGGMGGGRGNAGGMGGGMGGGQGNSGGGGGGGRGK